MEFEEALPRICHSNQFCAWVVYEKPLDFPDKFVARKWIDNQPTLEFLEADTLESIRNKLPVGLYCLERSPGDDKKIVESWL